MQAVMIRCQRSCKCMAACEVLPWPDCGWPSNTITHPTPSEAAKPPKPTPFGVQDLNSVRSILVNNTKTSLSYVVVCEMAFEFWDKFLAGFEAPLWAAEAPCGTPCEKLVKGFGDCWGSKIEVIFGCGFEASPTLPIILGMFFWASIISTIGPSFLSFLATSTYLGFWRGLQASYVWCQEGNRGPKQAP